MNLIGKWPSGLLSFLTAKGGAAPANLADTVVPVLNLEHFYAARDLEVVSTGYIAGLSAVDTGTNLTVPTNELWRVWDIHIAMTAITVASAAYVAMVLQPPGGSQVSLKTPTRFVSTAVGANYRDGLFIPQPIILMPGSLIGAVIMEAPAAGTMSINVAALIQRFSS